MSFVFIVQKLISTHIAMRKFLLLALVDTKGNEIVNEIVWWEQVCLPSDLATPHLKSRKQLESNLYKDNSINQ